MEDSKYFILAALYIVPFIAAIVVPGWRMLGVAAALVFAYGAWLFGIEMHRTSGIAHTIEVILFAIVLAGGVAGLLTRGVMLILQRARVPAWTAPLVAILGAALPVIWLFAGADRF